ncbi:prolyl aminopeptidase [Zavarzinia sp. CC-PAN008]|uniref:prolyl aminopeptidase n=1 Tax=Zavarzinia sp. CC-PAN008 TaxID=3243332 RepID=UPI003F74A360
MSGELYPEVQPYRTGFLQLDSVHRMYWEESGNPNGLPVIFLHGGPGAGAKAVHRRYFDPAAYRIVIFDQRGAGRSTPLGELRDNTTQHLVADIETLRAHLGIPRWVVFGGSWGSTLALAYAQAHPDSCLALTLRGIFLCRPSEIEWFLYGIKEVFPENWHKFANFLPESERSDLLANYHRRLVDPDPAVHMPAARSWSMYEGSCSTLLPSADTVTSFGEDVLALGLARMEAHYFSNESFLEPDQLLRDVPRIRHLPCVIMQGRYDMVCPARSAWDLHLAWPEARLTIVPDAGHNGMEPGIRAGLVRAMDAFRTLGP